MAASSTSLSFRHIFGVNGSVSDNIFFVEEDTVAYIAGHSLVLYNRNDKRQRFIYGSEISEGITALAVSPGKRYPVFMKIVIICA